MVVDRIKETVLQTIITTVYCTVCITKPIALLTHILNCLHYNILLPITGSAEKLLQSASALPTVHNRMKYD